MIGKEPSEIYLEAAELSQSSDPFNLAKAYRLFASIPGYLDADDRAAELKKYGKEYTNLERAQVQKKLEKKARNKRTTTTIVVIAVILLVVVGGLFGLQWKVRTDYDRAVVLLQEGEYREADHLLQFLFSYKDSEALRERAQQYLNYFDQLKTELEEGGVTVARSSEIYQQLQIMADFSEAEALLSQFHRQQVGYSKTASDGKVTDYRYDFDGSGNVVAINSFKTTDEGEELVCTETIYTDALEGQVTHDFSYTSKKLSDSTVIQEFSNSDGEYLVEKKTTYEDDPTKHYFYRWFDAAGNQVYGPTEDFAFPKASSKLTVLVFYRHLDENGRLVRSWQQEVTKKGKIDDEKTKEVVYAYDESGNLVLETHYKTTEKKNKVDYTTTYTYDDQGRLIQMVKDETRTDYTFNSFGEEDSTIVTKDGKETKTVYQYAYLYRP